MGACSSEIREVRFVIEPELLQVYVYVRALGDCPLGVAGVHHKTFPASVNCLQVLEMIQDGKEDYLLWSLEAPKG